MVGDVVHEGIPSAVSVSACGKGWHPEVMCATLRRNVSSVRSHPAPTGRSGLVRAAEQGPPAPGSISLDGPDLGRERAPSRRLPWPAVLSFPRAVNPPSTHGSYRSGRHPGIKGFREFSNLRGVGARGTGDLAEAFLPPYGPIAQAIVDSVFGGAAPTEPSAGSI